MHGATVQTFTGVYCEIMPSWILLGLRFSLQVLFLVNTAREVEIKQPDSPRWTRGKPEDVITSTNRFP